MRQKYGPRAPLGVGRDLAPRSVGPRRATTLISLKVSVAPEHGKRRARTTYNYSTAAVVEGGVSDAAPGRPRPRRRRTSERAQRGESARLSAVRTRARAAATPTHTHDTTSKNNATRESESVSRGRAGLPASRPSLLSLSPVVSCPCPIPAAMPPPRLGSCSKDSIARRPVLHEQPRMPSSLVGIADTNAPPHELKPPASSTPTGPAPTMMTVLALSSLAAALVHVNWRSTSVCSDWAGLIGSAYVEPVW